jgi:predicted MFS family arabinose efflux permease
MTKKQSWKIFWLLFLLYMFDYMDRMVIVSLFPFLKQDMGLTDAQCGLLVSSVYWSILIFSFPASILVDRWSRTKSISIMATFWSMATLACAFTKTFPQLLVTRTAIGIGEAGYAPGGTAMLLPIFQKKKEQRSLAYGMHPFPLEVHLALESEDLSPITLAGAMHSGWWHFPA